MAGSLSVLRICALLILPSLALQEQFVVRTRRQTSDAKSGTIQMNFKNFKRYASIEVGSKRSNFNVAFKLGSNDFWLTNKDVSSTQGLNEKKNKYNCKDSDTAKSLRKTFKSSSGTTGHLFSDTVMIASVQVSNVSFGAASSGIPDEYRNAPIDGEFGLSPASGLNYNGITSPLNSLTKSLDKPIVTMYTGKIGSGFDNFFGSLTFGAENTKNCAAGDYKYVPLAESSNWVTSVASLKVGDYGMPLTMKTDDPKHMIISEDTFFMYGPQSQISVLAKQLGAKLENDVDGIYTFKSEKCKQMDKMPKIIMTVGEGGKQAQIVISPKQYMELTQFGECRFLFVSNEVEAFENKYWYMGAQFMVGRCVALNWVDGTMGFADAE